MSGLLRRLTRRGPATADENRSLEARSSEPVAAPADAPAEPGGDRPVPAADEQQTQVLPATGEQPAAPAEDQPAAPAEDQPGQQPSPGTAWLKGTTTADQPTAFAAQTSPVRDLPAGLDPGDLSIGPPTSARRGKLRRRLRYLRHVRELLLRDLGGFAYEIYRTAGGTPQEIHRQLAEAKATRIAALDAEVAALEARLGEPHAETMLREAGIGGTCPECGELHASDARFCSRCGAPLDAKAHAQREVAVQRAAAAQREAAAQPATGAHPAPEPPPASVLWAAGPRPSSREEPAAEEAKPAPVTSQWLVGDRPTVLDRSAQPDEPAAAPADEPAATDAPAAGERVDATTADEPSAAAADQTPAAAHPDDSAAAPADEPPAATPEDERAAARPDEPPAPADEPAAAKDDPAGKDHALPARAQRTRKTPGEGFDRGPNGRRDDDVPSPVTSGDPLASRREQTP
jgi:hypothetical protein